MLVQKFPKASQEKHLLRGFSSGEGAMSAPKTIAIKLDTTNHCAASKYPASIGRESQLLVAARGCPC